MIPETANNRTIELYEAKAFPQSWSLCSVLASNIIACDATVYQRDKRWWLFGTVIEPDDTSRGDTVSVFWADALEGPWRPHLMSPVKYDVASSRLAGALIESDGRLFRPTQDCSKGYGSALTWCEVVKLTETDFAERLIARQACPVASGYHGLHTYNRTASFETVDLARSRPRWRNVKHNPKSVARFWQSISLCCVFHTSALIVHTVPHTQVPIHRKYPADPPSR
jgi:hypothetical protein